MTSARTRTWFDHPVVLFLGLLAFMFVSLLMAGWDQLRRLALLTRIALASNELSHAQYDALWALADLDFSRRTNDAFFLDPYEDDRATLDPHECVLLHRAAELRVPYDLILRFAPNYAYNTIIPRPA